MRSSNELEVMASYNYLSALRVASDDKAADKGVLVVMVMKFTLCDVCH